MEPADKREDPGGTEPGRVAGGRREDPRSQPVGSDALAGLVLRSPDGSLPSATGPDAQRQLLLRLQRSAGNAAVHRLLRSLAPPAAPLARDPVAQDPAGERTALIVDDEGPDPQPGQMRRSEFLDALKPAVTATAEEALESPVFRVAGCPWIEHWIEHYRTRSPAEIEQAVARYAPAAGRAATAVEYVEQVCSRVRAGILAWEATGELPQAPADGPGPPPGQGVPAAPPVAFKLRDGATADQVAPDDLQRRLGPGRPLDAAVGGRMGGALGADFSGVRVHDDPGAAELTRSLKSRAVAVGRHVAFAPNQFEPGTPVGDALIAHELAHVVQQGAATTVGRSVAASAGTLEADADAAAAEAVLALHGTGRPRRGIGPAMRSGLALQRCEFPDPDPRGPDPTATPGFDQPPLATTSKPADAPAPPPPVLTIAEIQDRLGLMEKVLARMETRNAGDKAALAAIAKARAALGPVRTGLTPASAVMSAGRVDTAAQIVDRCETNLMKLSAMVEGFAGQPIEDKNRAGYTAEIDKVRGAYVTALGGVLGADQIELFNTAEEAAARLPRALTDVDLKVMEDANGPPHHAVQQQDFYVWIKWTQAKLDEIEADARVVAQARQQSAADLADREKRFLQKAELVDLSIQGLTHYDRSMKAGRYLQESPNVFPGVARDIWRIWNRCRAMHDAAVAGELDDLRTKVTFHTKDPDVEAFYKHLPIFRFGSEFAVKFGIVLAAAIASAGVGGLVAGAIGQTTTLTGTLLAGAGTAAVEALAFTVVSRGLTSAVGMKNEADALSDFAWNFGLFSMLRGTAGLARRGAAAAGLPALAHTGTMVAAYPLMHAYGLLRFRLTAGRWPSDEELARMEAEGFLTFLALMVSMRGVQRYLPSGTKPSPLRTFHKQYGWRFETIEAGRLKMLDDFNALVAKGKAADPAEVAGLKTRAEKLEQEFKQILEQALKDKSIDLDAIRVELKEAGRMAPEGSGNLLAKELKVPETVGLKAAGGDRQYTYRWGGTTKLGDGLRALGARVEVSPPDPTSGQKTLTVTLRDGEPPLTFQERASPYPARAEVDVDPAAPEVVKLLKDFAVTDPAASRELVRMLSVELAKTESPTLTGPARVVRRTIEAAMKAKGVDAEAYLKERQSKGATGMGADPKLVTAADGLIAEGLTKSREWLELRDEGEYVGLVGEKLAAKEAAGALRPDQALLKNVHFIGTLFKDAAMTQPHATGHGRLAVGVDVVPELDLIVGVMDGRVFHYESLSNVKAVQPKGSGNVLKQAQAQNDLALAALRAHQQGKPFQLPEGQWAQVTKVTAVDAKTDMQLDLTGRVAETRGVTTRTVGPAAGKGDATSWTSRLPYTYREIETIVTIMRERQAMSSKGY